MLKGRGIAEGGKGFGVPFSLAIPRNQRIGPNGEKPGNYLNKEFSLFFKKFLGQEFSFLHINVILLR